MLTANLLSYNDNNGNPFSDVFWLASLVQSIGELEFGQQNIMFLSPLLKRVDRLLQFDRLMPSYNGVLTISCIRTLTQIALKLTGFISFDRVFELIKSFRSPNTIWQVRIEATRALLDLEFQCSGIDTTLMRFIAYLEEESSLRGQVKLGLHALRLCQLRAGSTRDYTIKSDTLVALLGLLECPVAFNNVNLRHYLFCILQVLAGRPPTLSGVPRDETFRMGHAETCTELKNIFAALVKHAKPPIDTFNQTYDDDLVIPEASKEVDAVLNIEQVQSPLPEVSRKAETVANNLGQDKPVIDLSYTLEQEKPVIDLSYTLEQDKPFIDLSDTLEQDRPVTDSFNNHDQNKPVIDISLDGSSFPGTLVEVVDISKCDEEIQKLVTQDNSMYVESSRKLDVVSNGQERRKPVVKLKVKQPAVISRAEDDENATLQKAQMGRDIADRGASSSISVDAPQRNITETASASNQNLEDVNSCHDIGSHVTASIGSAKVASYGDEVLKELQCTADSSKVPISSPLDILPAVTDVDLESRAYAIPGKLNALDSELLVSENPNSHSKEKEKKKSKDKKRKGRDHKSSRDDPEYLERKRLKKEKKQKKKELSKMHGGESNPSLTETQKDDKKYKSSVGPSGEVKTNMEMDSATGIHEPKLGIVGGEEKLTSLDSRKEAAAEVAPLNVNSAEPSRPKDVVNKVDMSAPKVDAVAPRQEGGTSRKIKIKLKTKQANHN